METSKCVQITFIIRNNTNAGFFLQIYQHLCSQTFCATNTANFTTCNWLVAFQCNVEILSFQQAVKRQGGKST